MTTKIEVRKRSIVNFLNAAREKSVQIEGDPDGLWFMLKHVRLGRERHKLDTCAMVKFIGPKEFVILIPDKIDTHCGIGTCQHFFQKCTFIKGWRAIYPHIITEVGNDLIEFAQRVAGLISNPDLCGFVGCGKRRVFEESKPKGDVDIPF